MNKFTGLDIDFSKRTKDNVEINREFDQTQLHLAHFQYQPHKDYLGHILRWGFAARYVNRNSRILDVGCGQDLPFMRSLGGSNINTVPSLYVGVDLNKISDIPNRKWGVVIPEFNFIDSYEDLELEYGDFNLIVNFEVFEHIEHKKSIELLKGMRQLLSKDGILIFSTPVYSERFKMARNHINELTKQEIEECLIGSGFKIINQFGTFGNVNDFKKVMPKDELDNYSKMSEFYGSDILGALLGTKYPEACRNITHICVRDDSDEYEQCQLKESIVK